MNIKKPLLRWSVAVLAVLMLTACGSPTSTPTTSSPAVGDSTTSLPATGENAVQKAQTGQVTFAVQFPQASLKKALIDDRTASIYVQWDSYSPYYTGGSALLTPDPITYIATATLDVPVGTTYFSAFARDNSGAILDITATAGEITAGSNTVYMTFLGGDWQFVDANDNLLPQSFDTTTLIGFSMKSNLTYGSVTKATIDTTKPYSWSDYQLQWQTTTAPIGPVMEAWHVAQFNAAASQFGSDWLNITDPSRSDSIYDSVPYQPGDRMVWIHDWEADDVNLPDLRDASGNDLGPAFSTAGNTEVFDGNHIVGNLMAMTFTSFNAVAGSTVASCDEFYYPQATTAQAARVAALKAGLAAKAGKAAIGDDTTIALGTITATYQQCDYSNSTIYNVTEVFSDAVKREFRAKGSPAASVFTPPAPVAPAAFSADWLNGKTLYQVWFGEGQAPDGTPIFNVPVVAEVTFNNGTITYNSLLNGGSGGSTTYDVNVFGMLTTNGDTTSGNTVVSGSTAQYIKTHYTINNVLDNVDLYFFNQAEAMAYASGLTASIPATAATNALGTWMNIDPTNNNVGILAFPDSSNYLMGEDGVADIGGGPGIEVGSYSFNPVTAETTFSVTYENNGDWGPATVSAPATYPISDLSDIVMTVVDPSDSSTFSFNRVTTDPLNPVIGSWYFTGTGMGETILVLLNNGQYYAVQVDSADTGNRFFESGYYSWNSGTGTFTGTGVFSSNPSNSAIAAPGETNTLTINISGNTLTIDGSFSATRL